MPSMRGCDSLQPDLSRFLPPPVGAARAVTGRRAARALTLALLLAALAACGKKDAPAGPGGAPGAGGPPPPEVGVIVATPGTVGLVTELPGRLEASRVAQVRARAAGIVRERLFREGSQVKAGQALFRIDPAPYQANVNSAQAALARAQANAAQARALAERYKPLVEANAVSKQEYANAVAQQKVGEADVGVARAALANARIALGYASVTAPISGRIGRALVTEGALVGQGEATPLAVVQQIDPIYANFTQSASAVLQLRRALADGKLQRADGSGAAQVHVLLEDGSEYPQPGKLLFTDLTVDASTGQLTLRAELPNKDGTLLPGMYVRVRIEQAQASNVITVPQQAVTRGSQGDTLMVVGEGNKPQRRTVKVSGAEGNRWVVREGLEAGEQVIVDGLQRLQMLPPGAAVKPVPWQPPGAKGAGTPAAKDGSNAHGNERGGAAGDKPAADKAAAAAPATETAR